jgi:hypothetical protein
MSRQHYNHRVARGLCPHCPQPAAPGYVYCHTCLADARKRYRARDAAQDCSAPAGPNQVGCRGCGTFCDITSMPFRTPCCGVTYFSEEKGTNSAMSGRDVLL